MKFQNLKIIHVNKLRKMITNVTKHCLSIKEINKKEDKKSNFCIEIIMFLDHSLTYS